MIDSSGNSIGGTIPGSQNVISSNWQHGIDAQGTTNGLLVEGNAIGTDRQGGLMLGNLQNGINLEASRNRIGGFNIRARGT